MKKTNLKYPAWRHYLTGLLLILLLAAASCNKEKNNPRHRNVVTATINGKAWEAGCKETPPFGCTIADLQYYPESGGFSLRTSNITTDTAFRIRLWEVFDSGSFLIRDNSQCGIIVKDEPCGRQGHYIDENDSQDIEILSIDNKNKIIEGRFNFIGHDTVCGSEPVHVTNGYFKVRYRP